MSDALPFVTLHEDEFEDLCCDLLEKEPEISTAERFGTRGQRQDGIDIKASRRDGGTEVAQCKCYALFKKTDLKAAVEAFRQSKQVWKSWDVRRFVVCVACSVRDRRIQNECQTYREQFQRDGIAFELWGDTGLAQKIRHDRPLAEKYFAGEKLRTLCGSAFAVGTQLSPLDAARTQLSFTEECSAEFEGEAEEELRGIRELARSGYQRTASHKVQRLRASPRWSLLRSRTRAQLLRLAASLKLDCDRDVDGAEADIREARTIDDRLNYQIVDAAIALNRASAQEALEVLGEPLEIDAFNIQLALLDLLGEHTKILASVEKPPFEPNAGTYRLASIAAVALRDSESADLFAAKAVRQSPEWYLVRSHHAKVKYLQCILPEFPMWHQLAWPLPPPTEYIRVDSESIVRLDQAQSEFKDFLAKLELDTDERRATETWRLACLCCNPGRRAEASSYAAELLIRDRDHLPAAIWAMHAGLDCDLLDFFDPLRSARKPSTFAAGDVQPLVVLLTEEQKFDEAVAVLEATRESFEQQNVLFIWRFLRAQVAAVQGDDATCSAISEEEPDPEHQRRLQAAVLRIRANRTGDFNPLGDFLEQDYVQSGDPSYLFDACEAWLRAGAAKKIIPYHEQLLKAFPTAPALRLIVQATFDAGDFELCSRLLRERRVLFTNGELPPVLHRVEVECLRQRGELTAAAALADGLASQNSDVETLLTVFQTQLSIGDLRSAATTARQFLTRTEITPGGLLHVARAIQSEDAALAIKLWDEAVRRGVEDPPSLVMAVNLAFRFGIEERAEGLMPKFYALSQQEGAPVTAYGLDDIRRLMAETQKARSDVIKLFGQGVVPLHLVAAQINTPLTALLSLQGWLNANNRQPLVDPPLLIRAGSKPSTNIVRSNQRLFFDTTSLIVADFLEILDLVEKEFAPLFVSAHLQEFLREEIENALPHQPARDVPRQKILDLVDEKRIASCSVSDLSRKLGVPVGDSTRVLIQYAKEEKAVVCDFALPNGSSEVPLAADERPFLISCGELAAAMLQAGIISKTEFDHAAARLASRGSSREDFAMQGNQRVILDFGVAEHLLTTGLLDPLVANVDVAMPAEDVQALRAELEASGLRLRTVERLKRLQDRLHLGLRDGIYKPVRSERLPDETRPIYGASERCLWDLLAAEASAATLVWTDDRFLSRYTTVGKLRSVGVVDILRSLHKRGGLTGDEFYSKLLQLREANARYLPISRDEILYHVNRAAVVKNAVTETPALTSLRRYISACCLDKERMQRPFNLKGKQFLGEFLWVLETVKSVSEAIAQLWEAESHNGRTVEIRADWVLQNLFIPYVAIFDTHRVSLPDDGLETYAVTIGLLLSAGFQLPSPWSKEANEKSSPRKEFYRWIESRFLSRLGGVAPAMLERIAAIEARTLTGLVTDSLREGRETDSAVRLIVGKVVVDLPPVLQKALPMTRHFKQMLRLTEPREMMEIDGHPFAAAQVLDAMVSASAGCEAVCTAEDNSITLSFTRGDASLPKDTLLVSGGGLPKNAIVREPRLPALIASKSERATFLRSKKSWFDVGNERLNASVKRILRRKTPIAVCDAIDEARDASGEKFYRSIAKSLRNHETVKVENTLPTKIQSLVDHLRLEEEGFAYGNITFEACAERLIREIGIGDAFERFATLPVSLPAPFSDALTSLPPDQFRRFLDVARARLHNPISRIHLFGVLAEASQRTPAWITDAVALRDEILDPTAGRQNWKSFAQLLHWTHRMFLLRADAGQLDSAVRLTVTWLHAGRLHNALIGHGVEHEKLRIAYGNSANAEGPNLTAHEKDFWFDAAHPRHVTRLPCLLRGIGSCLASISPDVASQFRLTTAPWERQPASAAALLRDTSLQRNALSCWLGGDSRAPLTRIFNEEALAKAQPLLPGEVVEAAVRELDSGSDELKRWHVLRLLIGDLPLPEPSGTILEQIIARTDFTALVRDQSEQAHMILSFACSRAAAGLSHQTCEALENHVFALIERYREQHSSDVELRTRAGIAVECLANLAMRLSDERDLYARYHELFTKAVWAWPEIAPLVGDQFSAWPPIRPLTRERGIWTLELTVRGLGDFRTSPRIPIRQR